MISEFKGFKIRDEENALVLTSTEYQKAAEMMKQYGIRNLEINPNFINISSLDFLNLFTFIEGLNVLISVNDISPINTLINLKSFSIEKKFGGVINFGQFRNLEDCCFIWGGLGSETVFLSKTISKLRIDGYTKLEPSEFAVMTQLNSLSLYHSDLSSLVGLRALKNLKQLDLTDARQMEDIAELTSLKNIEELRLDYCRNIKNLELLKELKNLKALYLNNIGEIETLDFITSLKTLEKIVFSEETIIKDGNLNYLNELNKKYRLKEAIFKRRKHYTHTPADLGYKVPAVVANIFKKRK